jgi:aldose 1-epimerase
VEILGRVGDLEAAGAKGSTAGIPLLHPWANRLSEPRYSVLGQVVVFDVTSPLLHLDEHGLPMHGMPWSLVRWEVSEAGQDFVAARLDWSDPDLLAIFPFPILLS